MLKFYAGVVPLPGRGTGGRGLVWGVRRSRLPGPRRPAPPPAPRRGRRFVLIHQQRRQVDSTLRREATSTDYLVSSSVPFVG